MPFSCSPDIAWDVTEEYGQIDLRRYLYEQTVANSTDVISRRVEASEEQNTTDDEESGDDRCRMFLPTIVFPCTNIDRIQIPTVHVYGTKDGWKSQSLQLVDLCEPGVREIVEHASGHEIPMQSEMGQKISGLIQDAAARSETLA